MPRPSTDDRSHLSTKTKQTDTAVIPRHRGVWRWYHPRGRSSRKLEDNPRCEKLMNGCSNDITRWVTGSGWRIEGTIDVDVSLCFGAGKTTYSSEADLCLAGYSKPVNCKPSYLTCQRSVNPQTAWCSHLFWKTSGFCPNLVFGGRSYLTNESVELAC